MPRFQTGKSALQYSFAGICIAFVLFTQGFNFWDNPISPGEEALNAIHSGEIYRSGNFLLPGQDYQTSALRCEPPLIVWLQVLMSYVFGLNEFSIRLPSVIAACIAIFFCAFIVYKKTESIYFSGFSAILLGSTYGFINYNSSGSGDAILTLFLLLSIYHHQNYLYHKTINSLWYFCIFLSFALLLKLTALFILPVLIISAFMSPSRKRIFKISGLYLIACLPLILFFMISESVKQGYLDTLINTELKAWFISTQTSEYHPWHFYIVNLFVYKFGYIICLLPIALIIGFTGNSKVYAYYCMVLSVYLAVISSVQSRSEWHDMPLFPIICIVITLFFFYLYQSADKPIFKILLLAPMLLILILPIQSKLELVCLKKDDKAVQPHRDLAKMMRNYKGEQQTLYLSLPLDACTHFYTLDNPNIRKAEFRKLRKNDIVFYDNLYKDSMPLLYQFTTLDSSEHARKIRID